jgi:DNA-directed RNA polymerase subunit L
MLQPPDAGSLGLLSMVRHGLLAFPFRVGLIALWRLLALTADLRGVSRPAANAIRRVMMNELPGFALEVGAFSNIGADCDPYILTPQICSDIAQIPLNRAVASKHVGRRFCLRAENMGGEGGHKPLVGLLVYSGSIEGKGAPVPPGLFNPSFVLAHLQPGYALEIGEIQLVEGRNRGIYDNFVRGAIRPLDAERHPDEAVRRRDGAAADLSGYLRSSSESDPRCYRLTGFIPAAGPLAEAEARRLCSDACVEVARRLAALAPALREGGGAEAGADAAYSEVALEGGLREGRLSAAGETTTLGELLVAGLCETADVAYAGYDIVAHDSSRLKLVVRHACSPEGDPSVGKVIARALGHLLRTFAALQQGFMEAPSAPPAGYPYPLEPTPQGTEA